MQLRTHKRRALTLYQFCDLEYEKAMKIWLFQFSLFLWMLAFLHDRPTFFHLCIFLHFWHLHQKCRNDRIIMHAINPHPLFFRYFWSVFIWIFFCVLEIVLCLFWFSYLKCFSSICIRINILCTNFNLLNDKRLLFKTIPYLALKLLKIKEKFASLLLLHKFK